jgi:hypothetical protein
MGREVEDYVVNLQEEKRVLQHKLLKLLVGLPGFEPGTQGGIGW